MLEIHVRLPSGCRAVLWPGTIAQNQHETVVHVTLRGNIGWKFAVAFQPTALGRDGQVGRKSVSHAQGGGAVRVLFVEIRTKNRIRDWTLQIRECSLQVVRIGVDAHCTGLDPGQGQPPPGFVVVLVQSGVVDAARVSPQGVPGASALRNVGHLATLASRPFGSSPPYISICVVPPSTIRLFGGESLS